MRFPPWAPVGRRVLAFVVLGSLLAVSCAWRAFVLPTVEDETLARFVAAEAARILRVAESAERAALYRFHLVDFPRRDILGLSIGRQQIFLSHRLARLAHERERCLWLLRQTLAHEIAHDRLGGEAPLDEPLPVGASGAANRISAADLGVRGGLLFRNYSRAAELEADREGLGYWRRLGWDCRIWVRIFEEFLRAGYHGDSEHPTAERLSQARRICEADISSGGSALRLSARQSPLSLSRD